MRKGISPAGAKYIIGKGGVDIEREILGDSKGLKPSFREELLSLYEYHVPEGLLITPELADRLAALTSKLHREVAVYLNRRGQVTAVALGNIARVELPEVAERRGSNRLSGIICVHTHVENSGKPSSVDLSALVLQKFDIMAGLGINGNRLGDAWYAVLTPECGMLTGKTEVYGPYTSAELYKISAHAIVTEIEHQLAPVTTTAVKTVKPERAILIGVDLPGDRWNVEDSLEELGQLVETAGAVPVAVVTQKRTAPDPAYFIGQGKVEQLALMRQELDADLLVFDDELSPAQQRNLEAAISCKIIDRTALILDIFAQRARTKEGKLQVELAQLQYLLPRLTGKGVVLSRLGGGIGTRGPGETKLEVDRRRIRQRIDDLTAVIAQVQKHRALLRKGRKEASLPAVALVGYTNAGKSTLLNILAGAGVLAEDKLFATLDPTTRKVALPGGRTILLTDTVGFIQKLPHHLVAAFRATLEEVVEADLLLHIVDVSHPQMDEQRDAVYQVLAQLGAHTKPVITVLNKIDKITSPYQVERALRITQEGVAVSALTGEGLSELLSKIDDFFARQSSEVVLHIPYQDSGIVANLHAQGRVIEQEYLNDYIRIKAELDPAYARQYRPYFA